MIPLKKVSARGRRYAYIRGTDIALVRGFVGTADQFDSAVAAAVTAYGAPMKSAFDGFRSDAAKEMHKKASGRARDLGRSYGLSVATITELLIAAGDQCTITAIPFDYRENTNADFRVRPMAASLDRIDNKLGYDPGNVRVVCACVNVALNEWGLDNFELVCRSFLRNLENRRMLDGKPAPVAEVTT